MLFWIETREKVNVAFFARTQIQNSNRMTIEMLGYIPTHQVNKLGKQISMIFK